MHHVKQGLYFEQGSDGSVTIHIFRDDASNSDKLMAIGVTAEEWQNVIAEMTPQRIIAEPFELPDELSDIPVPLSPPALRKSTVKRTKHR